MKKLRLNKEVIANISNREMKGLIGGYDYVNPTDAICASHACPQQTKVCETNGCPIKKQ